MSLFITQLTSQAVVLLGSSVLPVNQVLVALVSAVSLIVADNHDSASVVVLPGVTGDSVSVPDVQSVMISHLPGIRVCNPGHVVDTLGTVTSGCVDPRHHGSVRSSKSVYSTSFSVCSCVHAVSEISVFVDRSHGCVESGGTSHVYFPETDC